MGHIYIYIYMHITHGPCAYIYIYMIMCIHIYTCMYTCVSSILVPEFYAKHVSPKEANPQSESKLAVA